jgi:hypothetical protein
MITEDELLNKGNQEKIWTKFCGFLDLSLPEFMEIQEQLLMNQIDIIHNTPLADKFMPDKPKNIAEFRRMVPLTTYDDYAPYIENNNDEMLAVKPCCWARTSGRGGSIKWVPYTQKCYDWLGRIGVTAFILACTSKKGEVNIKNGMRTMQNMPARPYYTGIGITALFGYLDVKMIPPLEEYEHQPFEKRLEDGFKMALRTGVDLLGALTSILIRMGESFGDTSRGLKLSSYMLHPQVMWRLVRALIRSKRAKRPLLPKDLWPLKGLISYGMDTAIYREKLIEYWGKEPLEVYGGTEMGVPAIQAWNKKWMTFIPYFCFLEFIPEEEWLKNREDEAYQPSTVLLDEVKAGKLYELVITNFHGMPFLRYRIGDLMRIMSSRDGEAGIQLPQVVFESRADGLIDLAGFVRLHERSIWEVITNAGIKNIGWSARKEFDSDASILHIYIEPTGSVGAGEIERLVDAQLMTITDYKDMVEMLNRRALKVTVLPGGSFRKYYEEKQKAGADLAHLKPPQMNASDEDIQLLMQLTHS